MMSILKSYQSEQDPPIAVFVEGRMGTRDHIFPFQLGIFKLAKRNDIAYLPFDPTTAATLLIAALEFRVHRNVSLMPNVEMILYDDPETGDTAKNDFFVRLTAYFHY